MRFTYPDGEMETAASIGAVTDRSVRLWIRAPDGRPRLAELRVGDGAGTSATVEPLPDHDWVGAVELELAAPAPDQPFVVEVDGRRLAGRLAPSPGSREPFFFAFGSCNEPFEQPIDGSVEYNANAPIYEQMTGVLRRHEARFVALIGDQVYSDALPELDIRHQAEGSRETPSAEDLLETYRHLYRGYFNVPGFRALLEEFPTYMTWDDHDIFDGWGSHLEPTEFDRQLFRAADGAYREYQHLRNPGTAADDAAPYDYRFWFADVGFYVLDLRGVRDYESGVVIGPRQFERLDDFLAQATDRGTSTIFVAASVPVAHFSPRLVQLLEGIPLRGAADVRDRWSSSPFDAERNALLERLFEWQAAVPGRQAVILSGDVHVGAAFRLRRRGGRGTLLQFTSSALATPGGLMHSAANRLGTALVNWGEADLRASLLALETRNNFGVVRVRPLREGGHAVALRLYGFDPRAGKVSTQAGAVGRPTD